VSRPPHAPSARLRPCAGDRPPSARPVGGDLVHRKVPEHECDPQAQIDLHLGQGVRSQHAFACAHPLFGKRIQGEDRWGTGLSGHDDRSSGGLPPPPLGTGGSHRPSYGHHPREPGVHPWYEHLVGARTAPARALIAAGRTGDRVNAVHTRFDALAPARRGRGVGASLRVGVLMVVLIGGPLPCQRVGPEARHRP
jgi:hypothetical protein